MKSVADTDGNGKFTRQELSNILMKQYMGKYKARDAWMHGPGYMARDARTKADEEAGKYDQNDDGIVGIDEFEIIKCPV